MAPTLKEYFGKDAHPKYHPTFDVNLVVRVQHLDDHL